MRYYKMYNKKQFSKKLLKETKKLGLYPSDKEIEKYLFFIRKHFRIKPIIRLSYKDECGINKGVYLKYNNKVIFYGKPDLLVVLHEFRHVIQLNTSMQKLNIDIEEEAKGWSSSLFYSLYPKEYLAYMNES